jgi:hypothetical protein
MAQRLAREGLDRGQEPACRISLCPRSKAFNEGTRGKWQAGGAASAERYGGLRTTEVREGNRRRCVLADEVAAHDWSVRCGNLR